MYNNISNDAKTALKSRVVTTTARITLTSNNQVIDGNNLVNVTITDQCYQDGVIIGTAMCKEVEIELKDNNYDLADKEFSLEVGVLLPNSSYEYIPYGNFIVKDYQKIISSNHYKLIAYDYMDKFNATFVDDNPTLEDGVTYTTPMTLQSFYQYVANQFGVTIETQANLPNANFSITTKPYLEGLSGRNVLSRIAEMMGCFAKINRNNKLEMKLKNVTAEQFSRNEMNNSLERDNRFGPINVISLRLSQVEGENVTKRDEASISQYGETTLQIQDNPFCYTEALRLAAINAIYNKVDGFSYYPTTFNGKLIYLDAGDEVEVQDMETDTYYKTIILKQVLKIPSTRNSKFENKALTNVGLEHQFTPEQVRKDRRTEYLVDKQNGVIQQIVETTEEIEHQFETLQDIDGFAEGKYIYLDDASDELITSAKFNGETSQATRSGINLVNVTATTTTTNGVTCTVNKDKSVTLNGTNNGTTSWFKLGNEFTLPAGTYTLSNGNAEAIYSKAIFYDDAHNFTTANITTATFTSNVTIKPYIRINAGASFNNLTIYPMIVEGTYTAETMPNYEQYGVMPSPDYPSEIENVKGKNLLKSIDSSQTINGITFTLNEDKSITVNGTATANALITVYGEWNGTTIYQKLNPDKYYTISGSTNSNIQIFTRITNGSTITSHTPQTNPTFTGQTGIVNYFIQVLSGAVCDNITIKPQLEEGPKATSYVPYNSLEVKVENRNLLELKDGTYTNRGITAVVSNGIITLSGTSNDSSYASIIDIPLINPISSSVGTVIKSLNPTGTYTGVQTSLRASNVDTSVGLWSNNATNQLGTLSGNAYYLRIQTNYNITVNCTLKTQIEIGTATSDWEEHQEQIVYFPLAEGQKLYEGSYLADDGIHNVRGQVVLDGTENWAMDKELTNSRRFYTGAIIHGKNNFSICNRFVNDTVTKINTIDSQALTVVNSAQIVLRLNKSYADTLEAFKTWLSNNPLLVEYELEEPEIIPYNTEQQAAWNSIKSLHTYKTVTHIYSDAYAEIGYIKDNMLSAFETKASARLTQQDVQQLKIENGRISSEVSSTQSQLNNYYTKNEADNNTNSTKAELQNIIQQNKTEIEQTTQAINLRVSSIETNGVDKIETSMGYTFDNDGLNIDKEGAATASTIDNEAFKVKNKSANENVFFAGYVSDQNSAYRGQTIVESTNLVVKNYLNIEGASRFQPYVNPVLGGHGTGAFDIG